MSGEGYEWRKQVVPDLRRLTSEVLLHGFSECPPITVSSVGILGCWSGGTQCSSTEAKQIWVWLVPGWRLPGSLPCATFRAALEERWAINKARPFDFLTSVLDAKPAATFYCCPCKGGLRCLRHSEEQDGRALGRTGSQPGSSGSLSLVCTHPNFSSPRHLKGIFLALVKVKD